LLIELGYFKKIVARSGLPSAKLAKFKAKSCSTFLSLIKYS